MLSSDLTLWNHQLVWYPAWLSLQIFGICLAQNLVSDVKAVKANWWQQRWSVEGTGEGARASCPSQPHQVNRAHKRSHPAEDREPWTLNTVRFTTELSSTYTCRHKEFTSLFFFSDNQVGRRKYPMQTKQSTFCLPLSWDFNPNTQRMAQPTSVLGPFFCFLWFCSLDKCIYRAELHKDTCQLGEWGSRMKERDGKKHTQWIRDGKSHLLGQVLLCQRISFPLSEGWKKKKKKKMPVFLPCSSPLPAAGGGWWLAGRPTHTRNPLSVIFLHCVLLWPLKRLWTLAGRVCNFKPFQELWNLTHNVKKVPLISSDIFVSFLFFTWRSLHPAPQYLRAWLKIYVFCHWLKAYLFSLHPCLLNLDKYPCLFN